MTNNTSGRPRRVLAVDGPSLLHRAYHAGKARNAHEGTIEPRWAITGFMNMLSAICAQVNPGYLVVGFDSDTSSRNTIYPQYKAQRGDKDEALKKQMKGIESLLRDLGVLTITPEGLEADDVVASVGQVVTDAGGECVIATSDRDSFGLVSDHVTVLRIMDGGIKNAVRITPSKLHELYGVTPTNYLHYAAIRGDKSDNLPGVTGVGEKTAAKLLEAHTVEELLLDPALAETVIGKSYAAKLQAGEPDYQRNMEIMYLNRDVPYTIKDSGLGEVSTEVVKDVLAKHGVPEIYSRTARMLHATTTSATKGNAPEAPKEAAKVHTQDALLDVMVGQVGQVQTQPVRATNSLGTLPPTVPGTSKAWPRTL